MDRIIGSIQVKPHMLRVAERPYRNVIQAIELEAERLLLQGGGQVFRGLTTQDFLSPQATRSPE